MTKNIRRCFNKGISTPLALGIIAIISAIAGILIWYSASNIEPYIEFKESQKTNLPEDEMVDWKTYTDQEHGFSLPYPQGWDFYQFGGENSLMFAPREIVDSIKKTSGEIGGGKFFTIMVHYYDQEKYENELQPLLITSDEAISAESLGEIVIDDISGQAYLREYLIDLPGFSKGDISLTYVIPYRNGYLSFELADNQYRQIFEEMIDLIKLNLN
jgi:hypothetical protein